MKKLRIFLAYAFCFFLLTSLVRSSTTCSVPPHNNTTSGDNTYGPSICSQAMIHQFWTHFNFDKEDWDDGFGYNDPCNINLPLARTFNALYLLAYSAEDYAKTTNDFSGNALRWAYPYAASNIDELDARCGDGTANATSYSGAFVDDRVVLHMPFFYDLSVAERAGTILHESRHQAGKSHNGGRKCPRGVSCDTNWNYEGANMYHVLYLWWFAVDGTRTTTAMKNLARNRARIVHNTAFNTNPGYSI